MTDDAEEAEFQALWSRSIRSAAPLGHVLCPIGREFSQKLQEIVIDPLGAEPSIRQLAQAKYMLQEEWHAWRRTIPLRHFREVDPQGHHDCLLEVYLETYDRLQVLELNRRRPNLISEYDELSAPAQRPTPTPTPPPAPEPPPPQIAGIFIGEREGESPSPS